MPKIILGKRAPSFPLKTKVTFGGEELELNTICRYRTQKEYGALIDAYLKNNVEAVEEDGTARKVEAIFTEGQERNAKFLLDVIESWDIEDRPLNKENVIDLCDEVPGIIDAFKVQYREACVEGKLGN